MRTPVLSLGAGVQSSTLLLMAARGEIGIDVDLAVFADTGWEPRAVYDWLDWLEQAVAGRIRVERVGKGRTIVDELVDRRVSKKSGNDYIRSSPPLFVLNAGGQKGMLRRQCTRDFKIDPIRQYLRAAGHGPAAPVLQLLGISLDEVERMKPSDVAWIDTAWPLVDLGMTRADCLAWMEAAGYPQPPRSACIGCPYHSDAEWARLRAESPAEFEEACTVDDAIRTVGAIAGELYLHHSRVPLRQADLTDDDRGQLGFGDECEGMCGV